MPIQSDLTLLVNICKTLATWHPYWQTLWQEFLVSALMHRVTTRAPKVFTTALFKKHDYYWCYTTVNLFAGIQLLLGKLWHHGILDNWCKLQWYVYLQPASQAVLVFLPLPTEAKIKTSWFYDISLPTEHSSRHTPMYMDFSKKDCELNDNRSFKCCISAHILPTHNFASVWR